MDPRKSQRRFRKRAQRVFAGAFLAMVLAVPFPASAEPPAAHGWWWKGQPDAAVPAKVPAPPTVPAGGMYIASDASGPTAVSAMRFALSGNLQVDQLKLNIADVKGSPALQICPTSALWFSEQGGSFGSQPPSDCRGGTASAFGKSTPDGKSINFVATPLVEGSFLNVVILPLKDPASPVWPIFQLSLLPPADDSLSVYELPVTEPASEDEFETFSSFGQDFSSFAGATESFGQAPFGLETPQTAQSIAPSSARPLVGDVPPIPSAAARVALLVLLALVGFYYWTAFRPLRDPRLLGALGEGTFARSAPVSLISSQRPRGIGRFAKPRTRPPPRL